jgi:hypothetical protein
MWTNQLRQLLSYSADADDGAFFMDYADFCKHFNRVWTVRPPRATFKTVRPFLLCVCVCVCVCV